MYYVLVVGNKCFALLSRRFLCVKLYVFGKENIEKSLEKYILFQGLLRTM